MLPETKRGPESGDHQNKQLHKDGQQGLWSSNSQSAGMERAGSRCKRQPHVSKSSVTGRSPTQIAPSLRHSRRNASAIRCSRPERQAWLGRSEPGNPRSLHRLKPVSSTGAAEETTETGAPSSSAMSPRNPSQEVSTGTPGSHQEVSRVF